MGGRSKWKLATKHGEDEAVGVHGESRGVSWGPHSSSMANSGLWNPHPEPRSVYAINK